MTCTNAVLTTFWSFLVHFVFWLVLWLDYLVKITSNIYITLLAICVCWKSNCYTFDLGIDFLTLKMTFNHQNNTINVFSSQKSHRKELLHLLVVSSVQIIFFTYLTLKLGFWPWRWPLIIKIIREMDYQIKITSNINITLLAICVC